MRSPLYQVGVPVSKALHRAAFLQMTSSAQFSAAVCCCWAPERRHRHAYSQIYRPVQPKTHDAAAQSKKIPDLLLHPNRDEGIRSNTVRLVNTETNQLAEHRLDSVLATMDRKKFFLVRVSQPDDTDVPICKILARRDVFEAEKSRQIAAHMADRSRKGNTSKKRSQREAGKVKIIEVAWNIEPGDLGTRIRRINDFLEAGLKVEVGLHVKKRSKETSKDKAQSVLARVRECIHSAEGRITKEEGTVGELLSMLVEPSKQSKEAREAREAEDDRKKDDAKRAKLEKKRPKMQ